MYTGTLINDLMVTVERVGQRAQQQQIAEQIAEQQELHAIFAMQIPVTQGGQILTGQIFMGAA